MSTVRPKVFIPFRAQGDTSLIRSTLLDVVSGWWWMWGYEPITQSDGLSEGEPFNRHRAFNKAIERFPDEDVYLFAEADMLVLPGQVAIATQQASESPGLVIPFRRYRALSESATNSVIDAYFDDDTGTLTQWWGLSSTDPRSVFSMHPEGRLDDGEVVGSVFAVSRETLAITGGFTEYTSGVWYDDRIMEKAIHYLTGQPTRWVDGPAVHLHHPTLASSTPSTEWFAEREAALRNRDLLVTVRGLIKNDQRAKVQTIMQHRLEEK